MKTNFIILIMCLGLVACQHDHSEHGHGHGHDDEHGRAEEDGDHEEILILTTEQMDAVGITLGTFSTFKANDYVKATGTLGLPPNAYSAVSAKAKGTIRNSSKLIEGAYVRRGSVLAFLENPEFINYQRELLELKAELTFLEQELDRQQQLVVVNAGIEGTVQKLQSEVKIKQAGIKAIERQLNYLGITTAGLQADNIVERVAIIAPMSGFITTINMHNGMFIEPGLELVEIVNDEHLHLELDVFEKDISSIKEGQKITFNVPALGDDEFDGDVHVIGKEFNSTNKTVRVHGHVHEERPTFIKDLFIEAKIWLNSATVEGLAEDAIISEGPASYIYVALPHDEGEFEFEKILVKATSTNDGYSAVEIVDDMPEGAEIVTHGAYYVYAQSVSGELEHSH